MESDGNCFYRCISYFIYGNELKHSSIRKYICEKAKENNINNSERINLIENIDLSQSQYIKNNMQKDGSFAGDYEISIAHKAYNINIAVYRPSNNNNELLFMNFYNENNNYNRNLLILIYINNNHYQLGYYKNEEKIKVDENNEGINKLKQDLEGKNKKTEITPNKPKSKITPKDPSSVIIDNNLKIYHTVEKNTINCMIRLSSGNLAIGLSNGIIKIYDVKNICQESNDYESIDDRDTLLIIDNFRGKRINYLYVLKDKTLLCATFAKIHHIQLINNDTNYDYLGSIKLSSKELPKRLIELGNELIVSLFEKL